MLPPNTICWKSTHNGKIVNDDLFKLLTFLEQIQDSKSSYSAYMCHILLNIRKCSNFTSMSNFISTEHIKSIYTGLYVSRATNSGTWSWCCEFLWMWNSEDTIMSFKVCRNCSLTTPSHSKIFPYAKYLPKNIFTSMLHGLSFWNRPRFDQPVRLQRFSYTIATAKSTITTSLETIWQSFHHLQKILTCNRAISYKLLLISHGKRATQSGPMRMVLCLRYFGFSTVWQYCSNQ